MSRYRRIRIRTATREVLSAARSAEVPAKAFCPECGANVGWLGLADAAAACQTTAKEVLREIENGRLHFRERPDGQMRICRVSILK